MEVQIFEMAADAGRTLLTPGIVTGTLLGSLAFASGAAGRAIEFVEYRLARRSGDTD
jgi:hypothetical protein